MIENKEWEEDLEEAIFSGIKELRELHPDWFVENVHSIPKALYVRVIKALRTKYL